MADDQRPKDLVKLGPSDEGARPFIRRHPDGGISTGFLRRPRQGEPIMAGAVQLKHHENDLFEVVDEIPSMAPQGERESSGPAQVATPEYRAGWDRTFGHQVVGEA